MKTTITICCCCILNLLQSQTLKNTSYQNTASEKVLQFELTVPISLEAAWQLFTKDEKLKQWIAPLAHIELKTGGCIVTNYDKTNILTDESAIKLPIISYLDKELLILKVDLNNNFSKSVQESDQHLQEVIQFVKVGNQKTKIISSMIGWGSGADWEKTYAFFLKGNQYTYEALVKNYN